MRLCEPSVTEYRVAKIRRGSENRGVQINDFALPAVNVEREENVLSWMGEAARDEVAVKPDFKEWIKGAIRRDLVRWNLRKFDPDLSVIGDRIDGEIDVNAA